MNWIDYVNLVIALSGLYLGIRSYFWRKRFDEDKRRFDDMPYFKLKSAKIPVIDEKTFFDGYDLILENSGGDCFNIDIKIIDEGSLFNLQKLGNEIGIIGNGDSVTIRVFVNILKAAKANENLVSFNLLLSDKRGNLFTQMVEAFNIGQIENNRSVNVHPPIYKKR